MSRTNTVASSGPAPVFAALGDATRLELVAKLSDGHSHSIAELAADFPLTRQGVTKHLRVLEEAGVVSRSRVGRESRYRYVPESITALRDYLDQVAAQWDDALARLKSYVER